MKKFAPRKILVPVDFSDFSKDALEAAEGIAEARGAAITLLHVMVEPQASVPYEVYIDWQKVKGEIQADAEKLLSQMASGGGPAGKAEKRLEWGEPAAKIAQIAQEGSFDLIVMATHGRTGLSRLFLGSVAERVIRHAPCPVLSFRPKQQ
ncbi:MAG: universal stress protein [Candidatus Tectomicrobia bacterium]|uniref:Universal stress protein n=1 Tax=Tectimicrobiota bacterium TaxID=2528274 RepID=A0A932I0D3_UNCTE|nr:universal stress protein [Candidatus Tectomicrobia bacterium]